MSGFNAVTLQKCHYINIFGILTSHFFLFFGQKIVVCAIIVWYFYALFALCILYNWFSIHYTVHLLILFNALFALLKKVCTVSGILYSAYSAKSALDVFRFVHCLIYSLLISYLLECKECIKKKYYRDTLSFFLFFRAIFHRSFRNLPNKASLHLWVYIAVLFLRHLQICLLAT